MKQCPRCHRTYAGDDLSYCLDDGTLLIRTHDPGATQVSPFPPASNLPPTVAYVAPPAPATMPATIPATVPKPRQRSLLAIGAIVLAALVVGLAIGGFMFQSSNSSSSDAPSALPTPRSVVATAATPTPARAAATPLPTAMPTPTAMTTPLPSVTKPTPVPAERDCVLYNDKSDKSMVTVRRNCDTQDCDKDMGTIVKDYPNDTPVRVIKGSGIRGERFTWVKVVIKDSGQTVWVASAKIKCN